MAKGRPFIPEHDRQRDLHSGPIRTPYRHLLDERDLHYLEIAVHLHAMSQAGVEIDQTVADNAVKLIHWEREFGTRRKTAFADAVEQEKKERAEEAERWIREREIAERWAASPGIVYYILRGSLIKIGTTTRPRKRFDTLMPDAVLATEPGDRELERARHAQFGPFREQGVGLEYFKPGAPLIELIHELRDCHGVPDVQHASLISREDAKARVDDLLGSHADQERSERSA